MRMSSFIDELQKIAAATPAQMRSVISRFFPRAPAGGIAAASGANLKKVYRTALKDPTSLPVPLSTRLQSFKQWRRTGTLPRLDESAKTLSAEPGFSAAYSRSSKPVTFYSGGSKEGLTAAAVDPRSPMRHTQYLMPGSTRSAQVGLYGGPADVAAHFAGRRGGTSAIAEMTAPAHSVLDLGHSGMSLPVVPHGRKAEILRFLDPKSFTPRTF